jgi:hypothetical protein
MSAQQLTYEGVLELIRENSREFSRSLKEQGAEFDRRMQETNKRIGDLTGSIGRVIEHMVAGDNIIKKFQALNYKIGDYSRNKKFGRDLPRDMWGEIDLFLENGDIAILIEVKTTLETKDVRKHIHTLEKFRRVSDIKGDKRRFIGAVAGAVVQGDAEETAHENGLYVIVQSGEAVEIVPTPQGFKAKEW